MRSKAMLINIGLMTLAPFLMAMWVPTHAPIIIEIATGIPTIIENFATNGEQDKRYNITNKV
jgi:hypothetical protein